MTSNKKLSNDQIQLLQDLILTDIKKFANNVGDLLFEIERRSDIEKSALDNVAAVIDSMIVDFRSKIIEELRVGVKG